MKPSSQITGKGKNKKRGNENTSKQTNPMQGIELNRRRRAQSLPDRLSTRELDRTTTYFNDDLSEQKREHVLDKIALIRRKVRELEQNKSQKYSARKDKLDEIKALEKEVAMDADIDGKLQQTLDKLLGRVREADESNSNRKKRVKGRDWRKIEFYQINKHLKTSGNPDEVYVNKVKKYGQIDPIIYPNMDSQSQKRAQADYITATMLKYGDTSWRNMVRAYNDPNGVWGKRQTRIIPHTEPNETLWGAEKTAFMCEDPDDRYLVGAPAPPTNSNQAAPHRMVAWLSVNDLYLSPMYASDSAWTDLIKALHEVDKRNTEFVILTGSHMDRGGNLHHEGHLDWRYGTDKNGLPERFLDEDVNNAINNLQKETNEDYATVNLEIRDIWHPKLEAPSSDSLRKEIVEIIKSGKKCIIPACYSTVMFMEKIEEPTKPEEVLAYRRKIQQKIHIPVREFVTKYMGDINDFKRPKGKIDAELEQETKKVQSMARKRKQNRERLPEEKQAAIRTREMRFKTILRDRLIQANPNLAAEDIELMVDQAYEDMHFTV